MKVHLLYLSGTLWVSCSKFTAASLLCSFMSFMLFCEVYKRFEGLNSFWCVHFWHWLYLIQLLFLWIYNIQTIFEIPENQKWHQIKLNMKWLEPNQSPTTLTNNFLHSQNPLGVIVSEISKKTEYIWIFVPLASPEPAAWKRMFFINLGDTDETYLSLVLWCLMLVFFSLGPWSWCWCVCNNDHIVIGPPGALLFDRDQRSHWKNHFNCSFVQLATWAFIAQISCHRC